MENIYNILNDEQYVSLINKLSSSIYKYAKTTKDNLQQIKNNFQIIDEEFYQIEEINNIINISKSNEINLYNFFSEAKLIFKNLRMERKKCLLNASNTMHYILSEEEVGSNQRRSYSQTHMNNRKNSTINVANNNKILNLIMYLNKYRDIIGLFSEEDKNDYLNLINTIFQEFNDQNQTSQNNNVEINFDSIHSERVKEKYEKLVYDFNKYIKQIFMNSSKLEKEVRALSNNRNTNLKRFLSFNQSIKNKSHIKNTDTINNQKQLLFSLNKLKDEIKKERYNSSQKSQKIKQLKEVNIKLFNENQKNKNAILSLSENINLKKLIFKEDNNLYNENKDFLNIIKNQNNYYNNSNKSTYFKSNNNYNFIESLKKRINILEKENQSLKKEIISKEKENNLFKEQKNIDENRYNRGNQEKNENILKVKEELSNKNNEILNLKKQKENLENECKLKISAYEKMKNELMQMEEECKNLKKINELKGKINETNSKTKKNELEKNLENLDAINLKTSEINNFQNIINEKDLLIQKLKYNLENDKKTLENDIKKLKEKNNLLLHENKELKQSKVLLMESINEKTKINQSLNVYKQKVKKLEIQLEERKKSASMNFLFEEENNRIKSENEKLRSKLKDSENDNILMKAQNDKLKKEIENMNKTERLKYASQNISYCEEEYNRKDLADIANNLNNSEDMKIDYPGLNNIKNEYEELKKKFEELKDLVKYIISHAQCDAPDFQQKTGKVCKILEINLD